MADYLQHVDQRLKEEGVERINAYIDPSSKPKLIKLVEAELLERHVDTILEKGSIFFTWPCFHACFCEMANGGWKLIDFCLYRFPAVASGQQKRYFGAYVPSLVSSACIGQT
jgi:hypothetical protein